MLSMPRRAIGLRPVCSGRRCYVKSTDRAADLSTNILNVASIQASSPPSNKGAFFVPFRRNVPISDCGDTVFLTTFAISPEFLRTMEYGVVYCSNERHGYEWASYPEGANCGGSVYTVSFTIEVVQRDGELCICELPRRESSIRRRSEWLPESRHVSGRMVGDAVSMT